jgi:hypothetical protein
MILPRGISRRTFTSSLCGSSLTGCIHKIDLKQKRALTRHPPLRKRRTKETAFRPIVYFQFKHWTDFAEVRAAALKP